MRKVTKMTLLIVALVIAMGAVLVGCPGKTTPKDNIYTVTVRSIGGVVIPEVTVKVDGEDKGKTDASGQIKFKADPGEYVITVENLPEGYFLEYNYTIKTRTDKFEVDVYVNSSVIKGEIPSGKVYKIGDVIYDFSITDENGNVFTLSEVLEDKTMVLLNFWNQSCVPCMNEMPELELAYREYKRDAEVFGINVPLVGGRGTNKDLRDLRRASYTDTNGETYSVTFPLGIDESEMPIHFAMNAIPVSVVIDRYGVIAYRVDSSLDKALFRALFAKYTADDYVSVPPGGEQGGGNVDKPIERPKPNVSMPSSDLIEQAINGANFNYSYYPETDTTDAEYSWPWLIGDDNGTQYIYPSNHEVGSSFATIYTRFTITQDEINAKDGKVVLAFDFKYSCENLGDYFYVIMNNTIVYSYTGTDNWANWQTCYALVADEPGEYKLALLYTKDEQLDEGADTVRIKNMRLISISEIDIDSLDMPRNAARGWYETATSKGFNSYVTPVLGDDGFYRMGSADGPYLLANLMSVTEFNNRLETNWSISEFAVNEYFNYNTVLEDEPGYDPALDKTNAITEWAMAANNSELYGLTVVNDELKGLLQEFAQTRIPASEFSENTWLEFCIYFDHYGTDPNDKGICSFERNPIRGLRADTAFPMKDAYDGAFPDLDNIPSQYQNHVIETRLIIPRGVKYAFTPKKSGVYRFRSQSAPLNDTMAWLYTFDGRMIASTDSQYENPDYDYNFILTRYLEAGATYIVAVTHADLGGTGEFDFTTEFLGESAYIWQYAASNLYSAADDDFTGIVNLLHVRPVYNADDGKWYNAKKDENGRYVMNMFGSYDANLDDPLYVDFLTSARYFSYGATLEYTLETGSIEKITTTVSSILAKMWDKTAPKGGYSGATTLASIKGSSLTSTDWKSLVTSLYNTYGDNCDITSTEELELCTTIDELVTYLRDCYINLFDFRYVRFDPVYNIDESLYIDYTDIVIKYYNMAKENTGNPERGNADKGCVELTDELRKALLMFTKRLGFPELDTDWLRLCAHYEYMGPYVGD